MHIEIDSYHKLNGGSEYEQARIKSPGVEKDMADGIYTRSSTRLVNGQPGDERYRVTFCLSSAGERLPVDTRTVTLSLVSVERI